MTVSVLQILHLIVSFPTISQYIYLPELFDLVTKKLGENRISVRKVASLIFREFLKEVNQDVIFNHLIDNLKSDNWHIREETVQILLAALLSINEAVNYDFTKLIKPVASLMDDEKAKIRFEACETLAVLSVLYG